MAVATAFRRLRAGLPGGDELRFSGSAAAAGLDSHIVASRLFPPAGHHSGLPGPNGVSPPPSIIPSPGSPGIAPNVTATLDITLIAAGTILYGYGIPTAPQSNMGFPSNGSVLVRSITRVVNEGTLWHHALFANTDPLYPAIALVAGSIGNNGTIVGQMDEGLVYGAWSGFRVENGVSGRIYALTVSGTAIALSVDPNPLTPITNYGLIAAQATGAGGTAIGIETGEGGPLVNGTTGSILAEGDTAIAIYYFSGTDYAGAISPNILNEGLIRARSLDPGYPSIGIYLQHIQTEPMKVVNRGTIIADFAIYTDSFAYSPPQKAVEEIVNEAGGRIEGVIFLDLGDDIVVNRGTIVGAVLLDQGADRFDNSAGVLEGFADLGMGNDLFLGSAGLDAVIGGRDDDRLEGAGGHDLLLGGFGNDVLIGGTGNDGLFGEFGNDLIVTSGSDFVWGGTGDDRIELGDFTFELVDGGEGLDTLVLPGGARILDLSLALAADALHGIEAIEMRGGQELVVRAADVAGLSGGSSLRVATLATDRVDLVGAWTEGAQQTIGGVAYRSFASGGSSVLVSGGATVAVAATPPAGAAGLDPTAGPLAPVPGDVAGVEHTSATTIVSGKYGFFLHADSLTIGAEETWLSENGHPVLGVGLSLSITVVNEGVIRSATTEAEPASVYAIGYLQGKWAYRGIMETALANGKGAEALAIDNVDFILNKGTISAETVGDGTAVAFFGIAHGTMRNEGLIEARAAGGWAFGVAAADGGGGFQDAGLLNSGRITVTSGGTAVGANFINSSSIENTGTIEVIGGERAIAIDAQQLQLANSGEIIAAVTQAGGIAYGIYIYPHVTASINNSGLIRADVAIYARGDPREPNYTFLDLYFTNTGSVVGRLELSNGWERIWNSGSMTGAILFGDGNDLYDGSGGGIQVGGVYGEAGTDTLIGGDGVDVFSGGEGADILDGKGGADRFLYQAVAESTAASMDRIRAFQSGLDRIDLTAVAPSSVSWTEATDADGLYSLVSVATAGGTMTIRVDGHVTMADFLIAPPLNLVGTAAGDILTGGAGDDMLDGGGGADELSGGRGNDTYIVDNGSDFVRELAGEGTDLVYTSVSYALAAGEEVETLSTRVHGGTDPINLIGNAFSQTMIGNFGANLIDGRGGADVMAGLAGDDIYVVDNALDQVLEGIGQGNDSIVTSVSYVLSSNQEIETLSTQTHAGTDDLFLTGNQLNNTLIGNAGDNIINGVGGADLMIGLDGDDTYAIDDLGDLVIDLENQGNDLVLTYLSHTLSNGNQIETLSTVFHQGTDAINLGGNDYNNTLIGNYGANYLNGNGGVDVMIGLYGDDTYVADNALDVVQEVAGGGSDLLYSFVSYTLAAGQEVETISTAVQGGTAAINLTGNEFAQTIVGNAGANIIDGKGGNDTLYGLGGADTFAFTTAPAGNVDTIADFVAGSDKIGLDDAIFTAIGGALSASAFVIGTAAGDADDRIIYNQGTGQLFYDADGNGGGGAVLFATLSGAPILSAGDFQMI